MKRAAAGGGGGGGGGVVPMCLRGIRRGGMGGGRGNKQPPDIKSNVAFPSLHDVSKKGDGRYAAQTEQQGYAGIPLSFSIALLTQIYRIFRKKVQIGVIILYTYVVLSTLKTMQIDFIAVTAMHSMCVLCGTMSAMSLVKLLLVAVMHEVGSLKHSLNPIK